MATQISDFLVAWGVVDYAGAAGTLRWKGQGIQTLSHSGPGFVAVTLQNREGADNGPTNIFDADSMYFRCSIDNGAGEANGGVLMSDTGQLILPVCVIGGAFVNPEILRFMILSGPRGLIENVVV